MLIMDWIITTETQDPLLNLSTSFSIVLSDLFRRDVCPDGIFQSFIMRIKINRLHHLHEDKEGPVTSSSSQMVSKKCQSKTTAILIRCKQGSPIPAIKETSTIPHQFACQMSAGNVLITPSAD